MASLSPSITRYDIPTRSDPRAISTLVSSWKYVASIFQPFHSAMYEHSNGGVLSRHTILPACVSAMILSTTLRRFSSLLHICHLVSIYGKYRGGPKENNPRKYPGVVYHCGSSSTLNSVPVSSK